MTITNGNVADADEIKSALAFSHVAAINFAYDGADTTSQDNLILDTGPTLTGSTNLISTGGNLEYMKVDDEINNSNFNDHWTLTASASGGGAATYSETAEYLQLTSSTGQYNQLAYVTGSSDGGTGSAINYYNSGNDVYIRCRIETTAAANYGLGRARWGFTDGNNYVWLKTDQESAGGAGGNPTGSDSVWEIYIDVASTTADIYDDGTLDTADIDISSLTGTNIYFAADCHADSSGNGGTYGRARLRLHYLYSMGIGYDNGVGETNPTTASATVSTATIKYFSSVDESTLTASISADNGANWTAMTNKAITDISNTGTVVKHRFTFTPPTSITPSGNKVFGLLNGYGTYYGVY